MKKPQKTLILFTLFAILTLISVITVYAVHENPIQETITNTLCTYKSTAAYDYTAILTPNTIYNNKTTLKPNEGTLYTKITKQINITLTYAFQATLPTEAKITHSLTQTLTPWQYQITTTTQTTTNQTQIKITIPPVNKNELQAIKSTIESETGITASTYSLETTSTFTINANTTVGPIQQTFTPTLTISFKRTEQGDIITIEDLHQTKSGAITENQTITRNDIINQRYASYILITISAAGLCFSTYFYQKTKPTPEKKPLEKLIAPYKEMIAETTQMPPETTQRITMETLEDLAKISENLVKPILHKKGPKTTHTFYIIDNNTKYEYTTEET